MKSGLRSLFAVILLISAGGCIEFEEQTMSYRYDEAADTLRIFQNYRGIFGGEAGGEKAMPLTKTEISQLDSVMKGQRTFFFANWIFEYNEEDIGAEIAELKDPAKPKKMKADDATKWLKILELALGNVRIENGPFYLSGDKLCGVQSVTVTKCSEIVAAFNELAPVLMGERLGEEGASPAERKAIAKFTGGADLTVLRLDGNGLTYRWPISKASYEKTFGVEADDPEKLKATRDAGLGIQIADDVVTLSLGKPDDEITRLTLPFSKVDYTCNAIAPVRELRGVEEAFDAAAAEAEFLSGAESGKGK